MQPHIQTELIRVLKSALPILKEQHSAQLFDLSNTTIHTASIWSDEEAIDIAVVLYASAKIIEKKPDFAKTIRVELANALTFIRSKKEKHYRKVMTNCLAKISRIDSELDLHVMHVIQQARIQKGSRLYDHGISLTKSASLLGISLWELYNYIGKTTITDATTDATAQLRARLLYTQSVFTTQYEHKKIVFDAGPIITLALTNQLPLLPRLKSLTHSWFYVPSTVYREVIEKPLSTKRHKLESFQVLPYFKDDTLHVLRVRLLEPMMKRLEKLANAIYVAQDQPIAIVQAGEMHALATVVLCAGTTLVVDERTTRMLLETPQLLQEHLARKLHTTVTVNQEALAQFKELTKHVHVVRTAELLAVGMLHSLYEPEFKQLQLDAKRKKEYLKAVLWAIKLAGCAISEEEIIWMLTNTQIT